MYLGHPREVAVPRAGPVQYPELGAERVLLFLERAAALSRVVAAHGTVASPHPTLARNFGLIVVAADVGFVFSIFFGFRVVIYFRGDGRGVPGSGAITSMARLLKLYKLRNITVYAVCLR